MGVFPGAVFIGSAVGQVRASAALFPRPVHPGIFLSDRLIGNAVIDKPEDLTYFLDPERLAELRKEKKLS